MEKFITCVMISNSVWALFSGSSKITSIISIKQDSYIEKSSSHLPWDISRSVTLPALSLSNKLEMSHFSKSNMVAARDTGSKVTVSSHPYNTNGNNWLMDDVKRKDENNTFPDILRNKTSFLNVRRHTSVVPDTKHETEKFLLSFTTLSSLAREVLVERMISKVRTPASDAKQVSNELRKFHLMTRLDPARRIKSPRGFSVLSRIKINSLIGVKLSEGSGVDDTETKIDKKKDRKTKMDNKSRVFEQKKTVSHTANHVTELWKLSETPVDNTRIRRSSQNESVISSTNKIVFELEPVIEKGLVTYPESSNCTVTSNNSKVTERTAIGNGDGTDSFERLLDAMSDGIGSVNMKGTEGNNKEYHRGSTDEGTTFAEQTHYSANPLALNSSETVAMNLVKPHYHKTNSQGSVVDNTSNDIINKSSNAILNVSSWEQSSPPTTSAAQIKTNTIKATFDTKFDKTEVSNDSHLASLDYHLQSNSNHAEKVPLLTPDDEKLITNTLNTFIWPKQYETVMPNGAAHAKMIVNTDSSTPAFIEISEFDTSPESEFSSVYASSGIEPATRKFMRDSSLSPSVVENWGTKSHIISQADFNANDKFREYPPDSQEKLPKGLNSDTHRDIDETFVFDSNNGQNRHEVASSSVKFGPDWEVAKRTWRYAWEMHVYVLGGLFGLVGLYTILSVLRLWRVQRLLPNGYFLFLCALVTCLCITRSIYLLQDGYNSRSTYHVSLNHFLYSVSFPCLTSAFSVLIYWFLTVTQTQLVSPSLQNLQVLVPVIITHFVTSIATDVLIGYNVGALVMQFVCHVYFVTWGFFLFFGYAYFFRKLYSQAINRQDQVIRFSSSSSSTTNGKVTYRLTLGMAVKVTFLTAICGLAMVGLEMYAVVDVFKTFTTGRPKPWPWWLYHTVLRLMECFMCFTLSYSVSLPFKYRLTKEKCSSGVTYATFTDMFCCRYTANKEEGWSDFEQYSNFSYYGIDNIGSLTEYGTEKLLNNGRIDVVPMVGVQPQFSSKTDSLLIIDEVYVRFQTDLDINRIVDSSNKISHRSEDFHKMNTFPLRDNSNAGYLTNPGAEKDKCSVRDEDDNEDKSQKTSVVNTEFFRVPSSVSIADSIEKELARAFESFKVDVNVVTD